MIIIIDGYNLLKKIFMDTFISEKQRTAFVNLMGRYSKKRGHKVIIVFDAGPCRYPLTEKDHGVTVMYSGEYKSADDIIMDFVQQHENKDILVVTEDREIIQSVERCREDALNPRIFYEKVKNAFNVSDEVLKKELSGIIKLSDTENEDLDDLMRSAASMNMQIKEDDFCAVRDRQKNGQEIKKNQRNRLKKVDKL